MIMSTAEQFKTQFIKKCEEVSHTEIYPALMHLVNGGRIALKTTNFPKDCTITPYADYELPADKLHVIQTGIVSNLISKSEYEEYFASGNSEWETNYNNELKRSYSFDLYHSFNSYQFSIEGRSDELVDIIDIFFFFYRYNVELELLEIDKEREDILESLYLGKTFIFSGENLGNPSVESPDEIKSISVLDINGTTYIGFAGYEGDFFRPLNELCSKDILPKMDLSLKN